MGERDQSGGDAPQAGMATGVDACFDALRSGAVLVTVNQRLARHYLEAYQQHNLADGRRIWETPAILPLDAWWRECHDHLLADGVARRARIPELLMHARWKQAVQGDPDLRWLLDVDTVAGNAARAWELARAWGIDVASPAAVSADALAFRRWATRVTSACERESVIDPASAIDALITHVERGAAAARLPASLWHAGFLQPDVQQQRLFRALESVGVSVHKLEPRRQATLEYRRWADDDQELLGIAEAVRCRHEADRSARLGVVVSNLSERRASVTRAFDRVFFPALNPAAIERRGRPFDVSLGSPLADQPVVRTALRIIELHVASLVDDELSALLLSPHLVGADSEADGRRRLDRRLRERRVRRLDATALHTALPSSSELRQALGRSLRGEGTSERGRRRGRAADGQAAIFASWLFTLGWPGAARNSEEHQAVEAWYGVLDDLQRLESAEPGDAVSTLRQLRRLARERIFQPESPARPIRIMGRLESHGLELDGLWVTGLDQEQWPPPVSPDPFLPLALQRDAGIPAASASTSLALAEAEFALWTRSTDNLYLNHAVSRDGHALSAAACISDHRIEWPDIRVGNDKLLRRIQGSTRMITVADPNGPALPAGSEVRGGARLFEDQARCPFKAFATHRLGARTLEEAGPGLDPRQHGTLLHEVLEQFWQSVGSHAALLELYRAQRVDDALHDAIDAALDPWALDERPQRIERARLHRLLREWLDRAEYPREPFEVVATEQACTVERAGVAVTLKIDRIDRLDSGQRVMLDYKTGGGNRTSTWTADRIDNPQLPLYALSDETIDGVCFAQIVRHDLRFVGMAADDNLIVGVKSSQDDIDNWRDWRAHWTRVLDACAREISDGLATVTPIGPVCNFCELKPLCRIDASSDDPADLPPGSQPDESGP